MINDGNESQVLRSMTADEFTLPNPNRELYKNGMAYSGPVIWNYRIDGRSGFRLNDGTILNLTYE